MSGGRSDSESYPSPPRVELERAKGYLLVLLRHRKLVVAVFLGTLATIAVATLLQTPIFRASSLVLVDRGELNVVGDFTREDRSLGLTEFYGTQQRLLTSRALVEHTLDHAEAWNHPVLQIEGVDSADARDRKLEKFRRMLDVEHLRDSQLMDISVLSPDPAFSRDLANAHARAYLGFVSASQSGLARNTSSLIREETADLQRDIADKEALLRQFGEEQDVVLEQSDEIIAQQLSELYRELSVAQGELATTRARYESLLQSDPQSSREVIDDLTVQRLRQELATLEKEYVELSTRFAPEWPALKEKRNAIEEIQRRLDGETKSLADKLVTSALADYQAASSRVDILKEALEQQRMEARDLSARTAQYNNLRAELEGQRTMLQDLLNLEGRTGLSADLGERQNVSARIIEEARLPGSPYKPNLVMNLLIGGILGLVLAPAMAFLVNAWDTSVHNDDDVRRFAGTVPCLATIPHLVDPKPERDGSSRSRLTGSGAGSKLSAALVPANAGSARSERTADQAQLLEQFKFLRSGLLLATPAETPRVIMVTSGSVEEGKTFVATHIAAAFADLGKKVLLIDADLRRPSVHKRFGLADGVGLADVLAGQRQLHDGSVHQADISNLFLLPAGSPDPSPAESLSSRAMETVLQQCRQRFDIVIVDSAPLFPIVDSQPLVALSDSVLLVVRSGATAGPAVKRALELVEQAHGTVAGIVLNDIDLMDLAQSYYYRRHAYGYPYNSRTHQRRA